MLPGGQATPPGQRSECESRCCTLVANAGLHGSVSARAPVSKWRWQGGAIACATIDPTAWVRALDTGRLEGPS